MTVAVGHLIVGFGREPVIGVDSDSPALLSFVSHYRPDAWNSVNANGMSRS